MDLGFYIGTYILALDSSTIERDSFDRLAVGWEGKKGVPSICNHHYYFKRLLPAWQLELFRVFGGIGWGWVYTSGGSDVKIEISGNIQNQSKNGFISLMYLTTPLEKVFSSFLSNICVFCLMSFLKVFTCIQTFERKSLVHFHLLMTFTKRVLGYMIPDPSVVCRCTRFL